MKAGYLTKFGFLGKVAGKLMLFSTEEEYLEYLKDMEENYVDNSISKKDINQT